MRCSNYTMVKRDCHIHIFASTGRLLFLTGVAKVGILFDDFLTMLFSDSMNLKNVIDAIDLSKATITTLPSGRVQGIPIYAFIPEAVENQWLFKVSTRPYSVLCTDQFVDAIQQHGWTGFNVQPVWDSEVDPFPWGPTVTEVAQRPEVFGPNGFVKGFESAWPEHWKHRNQCRY